MVGCGERGEPRGGDPAGDIDAAEITLALGPDGSLTLLVDGEDAAAVTSALEAAASELERRGRERFPSFVARAERLPEAGWVLTVDPL